jgi:hypothetical protein
MIPIRRLRGPNNQFHRRLVRKSRLRIQLRRTLGDGTQICLQRHRTHRRSSCDFDLSRSYVRRVLAAFAAARCRERGPRFRALLLACRDSEACEAALRLSWRSAFNVARERFADGFLLPLRPLLKSRSAWRRTFRELLLFFGGGKLTPARRAFDKPIAMACFGERAPCFPWRTCSISSRTNSPACVEGDLPSCASRRARSITSFSGMDTPFKGRKGLKVESELWSQSRREATEPKAFLLVLKTFVTRSSLLSRTS